MATIDHSNTLDLRDLAELARECATELEAPEEYDEDDLRDSRETLVKLSNLAAELGVPSDETDGESVADALDNASDSHSCSLIDEDYFEDYCRELVQDIGDMPSEIPAYISNNIDWEGVADDLRVDYTDVTLDGTDYLIR